MKVTCYRCKGEGELSDHETCPDCRGKGFLREKEKVCADCDHKFPGCICDVDYPFFDE